MFQTVQCVVAHALCIDYLSGDGNSVSKQEILGYFETPRDAEQLLADIGFTRTSWGGWVHRDYAHAYVQRILLERK
jgi:hypothetical protein